jgi:hypothetical protein
VGKVFWRSSYECTLYSVKRRNVGCQCSESQKPKPLSNDATLTSEIALRGHKKLGKFPVASGSAMIGVAAFFMLPNNCLIELGARVHIWPLANPALDFTSHVDQGSLCMEYVMENLGAIVGVTIVLAASAVPR